MNVVIALGLVALATAVVVLILSGVAATMHWPKTVIFVTAPWLMAAGFTPFTIAALVVGTVDGEDVSGVGLVYAVLSGLCLALAITVTIMVVAPARKRKPTA